MQKLQDFARECGVTDRTVQRHLVTYADELEGLYQRQGPNGTWLTDEACAILRSKMRQNPIVVGDRAAEQAKEELQRAVLELQSKLITAHELLAEQRAQLDAGQAAVLRLQAAEGQAQAAQEALGAAQTEVGILRERLEQQARAGAEAVRAAQDDAARLRQELEAMRDASLWQRIRGWH